LTIFTCHCCNSNSKPCKPIKHYAGKTLAFGDSSMGGALLVGLPPSLLGSHPPCWAPTLLVGLPPSLSGASHQRIPREWASPFINSRAFTADLNILSVECKAVSRNAIEILRQALNFECHPSLSSNPF
jgi:hypothetical protein